MPDGKGCVQGHENPNSSVETKEQTAKRYALAVDAILTRQPLPDAIFLQELDVNFFDEAVNPKATQLLEKYEQTAVTAQPDQPGTGVLLRKGAPLVVRETRRVGADNASGGTSKSATAVLVSVDTAAGGATADVWLVSIHLAPLKFHASGARHLLAELGATIFNASASPSSPAAPRIVLGGDFNAEMHDVAELRRTSCLGALARVHLGGGIAVDDTSDGSCLPTGLSANFSTPVCIDHLFVSPGLRVGSAEREKAPCSPFAALAPGERGPAQVVGASDHVWQRVDLFLD